MNAAINRGDARYVAQVIGLLSELDTQYAISHGGFLSTQFRKMKKILESYRSFPERFQGDIDRIYPLNSTHDLDRVKEQIIKDKDVKC